MLPEDKISILFLLFEVEKAVWTLKMMQKIAKNPDDKTNFLREIASQLPEQKWRGVIVEALKIVGAMEILERLGIPISYNPYSIKECLHINLALKVIYAACERCCSSDEENFSKFVATSCGLSESFNLKYQMEVNLLLLVCANKIYLGKSIHDCNIELLRNFFTQQKMDDAIEILKKIPCSSESVSDSVSAAEFKNNFVMAIPNENLCRDFYVVKKGLALIINQEKFYEEADSRRTFLASRHKLSNRDGTEVDKKSLKNLFKNFNYDVFVEDNISDSQIVESINKIVLKTIQEKYDCIILCILSHGEEGVVYGSNSIAVKVSQIKSLLTRNELIKIPKILLIQACQGTNLQKSVENNDKIETDGPTLAVDDTLYGDMLTFWSTIQGFASIRNVRTVSLCNFRP